MKKCAFILLVLFAGTMASAQSVDNNWVFGYFGQINFDGGVPNDAGGGPIDTDEASGTISDSNGDLLFSTDGMVVRDKNGNVMPNGSGLKGSFSSTQNVVIVPFPGDTEERFYYIFTVGAQMGMWGDSGTGLEYVVVDMNAQGGLGDVVQTSTELIPNLAEKIHATYHSNKRDVWVVVHEMESDAFYSVLVTCEGIQEPVISNTGSFYTLDFSAVATTGAIRLSHDGPSIAATFNTMAPDGTFDTNILDIGSFDHESGQIAITETIERPSQGFGTQGYGLEFSPDNNKLYWSILGNGGGIFQYDLNTSPTVATEFQLNAGNPNPAGMQLGPDGVIYFARSGGPSYLSRIANPNASGPDVVVDVALTITNQSKLGLPNNWMYPYPEIEIPIESENFILGICPGKTLVLDAGIEGAESYEWNTGENSQSIEVSGPGSYEVLVEAGCNTYVRTFEVENHPEPVYTTESTAIFCTGDSVNIEIATESEVTWTDGGTTQSRWVSHGGTYPFTVSNEFCDVIDQIRVEEMDIPHFSIPDILEICENNLGYLVPEAGDSYTYYLNGVEAFPPFVFSETGDHTISGENTCDLVHKQLRIEEIDCGCQMFIPNAFTPDADGLNDLFKPILNCEPLAYQLRIFDRWGVQVFSSTNPSKAWNGSMEGGEYFLPTGIYLYTLDWEAHKQGEKTYGQEKGHIQLIR